MGKSLCSVGLDVGTSTTQLVVSRLRVENSAGAFSVPRLQITGREILYRSPVYFTPLLEESRVDGDAIADLVAQEYCAAGITREQVDTGAVIITGETSRKENARAVLKALSGFAGAFVVATAGPDLESVLAAKGAGAVDYSAQTHRRVLHMDIGGGTSNLALVEDGHILCTGCLNVGGRLIKRNQQGVVTYLSPVLAGLTDLQVGQVASREQLEQLAKTLCAALEMAAGRREETPLLAQLTTRETGRPWVVPEGELTVSFSGGVAACMERPGGWFGDMGPELAAAIRSSALCRGDYVLGRETLRATVIGAGCHSAQLSGSTVFLKNAVLPVQNLPVAVFTRQEQGSEDFHQCIQRRLQTMEPGPVVLGLPGLETPGYDAVTALALQIHRGLGDRPAYICLEADMAKALGHSLWLLDPERPYLCIDSVALSRESFLDVGAPIGPAVPVVVKTLVLSQGGSI